ncbi:hypothetical protein SGLAM104S_08631 [Streptomyces glaucescens]
MTKHIAVLGAPYHGHVNHTLPVVADLVGRGHRVTYVTTEHFAPSVSVTGARVVTYESVWRADRSVPPEMSADEMAEGPLKMLRENVSVTAAAERELAGDRPDVVVYDTLMNFSGRVLAEKWEVPAAQLIPMLASNEHFSVLAALAQEFPAMDPHHPALLEFGMKLAEFRVGHGLSVPGPGDILGVPEELNVVFVAKEFQPAADTFDERYVFVGPAATAGGGEAGSWQPPQGDAPVLLIALGTLFNERPDFYRACLKAFADLPFHVVMATGQHVDPAGLVPNRRAGRCTGRCRSVRCWSTPRSSSRTRASAPRWSRSRPASRWWPCRSRWSWTSPHDASRSWASACASPARRPRPRRCARRC